MGVMRVDACSAKIKITTATMTTSTELTHCIAFPSVPEITVRTLWWCCQFRCRRCWLAEHCRH